MGLGVCETNAGCLRQPRTGLRRIITHHNRIQLGHDVGTRPSSGLVVVAGNQEQHERQRGYARIGRHL